MLFKNLGVQIKDVTPTSLLRDRARVIEGNPDFSNKDIGPPQATTVAEDKSGVISALNQVELALEVTTPSHLGGHPHQISPVCIQESHLFFSYLLYTSWHFVGVLFLIRNIALNFLYLTTQYAAPAGALVEDEKLAAIGFSDQLPPAQGLLQPAASQSPFSMSQVWPSFSSFFSLFFWGGGELFRGSFPNIVLMAVGVMANIHCPIPCNMFHMLRKLTMLWFSGYSGTYLEFGFAVGGSILLSCL